MAAPAAREPIKSMVTAPIEPDASAAMVQAAINPGELVDNPSDEIMYQVLPNTLVFTKVVKNSTAVLSAKRPRIEKERFPQVVGGGFDPQFPLYVLGVAYDGIPNTAAAMHWPNERGRLVTQVTGTCTIAMHNDDLDELEILDKLAIDRNRSLMSNQISMVKNYNMPKIKRFDVRENDRKNILLNIFLDDVAIDQIENETPPKQLSAVTDASGQITLSNAMKDAGYEEIAKNNGLLVGNDLAALLKEVKRVVLAEMSPFAILLEKGHESARILLTPA